MKKQQYVLGFLFNHTFTRVTLIRKTHPPYQAGKLNGIGGGVEGKELPCEAMIREFVEEAGAGSPIWMHYAQLRGKGYEIACFYSSVSSFSDLVSKTEEKIEIHSVYDVLLGKIEMVDSVRQLVLGAINHRKSLNESDQRTLLEITRL